MYEKMKIKELVLTCLIADAYSLGAHWVYDEKQLSSLDINWEKLNNAKSIWHKDKKAGDFTHYGDQLSWLYEFVQNKDSFDVEAYLDFWSKKMQSYNGYIDGATRQSLEYIKENKKPTGSNSSDLSIIGRIVPLLLVSKTKSEFLQNVKSFVQCTHNSPKAIKASDFFAKLLLAILDGNTIEDSLINLKEDYDSQIQDFVTKAIKSRTKDTFETIRNFGPACDINEGFAGVIHLLCKYDDLKQMLIHNAKAGGDSSARGMLAALIFMAQKNKSISQIPKSWFNIKFRL